MNCNFTFRHNAYSDEKAIRCNTCGANAEDVAETGGRFQSTDCKNAAQAALKEHGPKMAPGGENAPALRQQSEKKTKNRQEKGGENRSEA